MSNYSYIPPIAVVHAGYNHTLDACTHSYYDYSVKYI